MKDLNELSEAEKAVLLMSCQVMNYSLSAHVPKKAITNKIINMPPKYLKKSFKSLVSNGFLIKHPTGGNTTFGLSKKGLKAGNTLFTANFNK